VYFNWQANLARHYQGCKNSSSFIYVYNIIYWYV